MSRRTLHSLLGTLVLMGIVVLVYGLDWRAALWADGFNTPPAPAPHSTFHMERVNDEGTRR
jgi:hypothetical protein